jgi:cysteine-rich repeat protein
MTVNVTGTPPVYLGSATADGSGAATLAFTIPNGAPPGVSTAVQAVVVSGQSSTKSPAAINELMADTSGLSVACQRFPDSVCDRCVCDDADGDGVCDADDVCPLGDDTVDADGNGTPDACDLCAEGCATWYDGCNTCSCDGDGNTLFCTHRFCPVYDPPECTVPDTCGDGIVAPTEDCDDGNLDALDGCSPTCEIEQCPAGCASWYDGCNTCSCDGDGNTIACTQRFCPVYDPPECAVLDVCGDGIVAPTEDCDDGNNDPFDGCSPTCEDEFCPDGCDTWFDGCNTCLCDATTGLSACTQRVCQVYDPAECLVVDECGDGVQTRNEACDDGNTDPFDGCSPTCEVETCPDGCDTWFDGCNTCLCDAATGLAACTQRVCQVYDPPECLVLDECGDGVQTRNEACNDGNTDPLDGCSPTCELEQCPAGCASWYDGCNTCICDGDGGTVACTQRFCPAYDPPECNEPIVCGDGIVSGDEACDDGNTDPFDGCSPTCEEEYCPDGCDVWNDGCNTCDCTGPTPVCTQLACLVQGPQFCDVPTP